MVNIETSLSGENGFYVDVTQMSMSKGTLHIEIETTSASIRLYATEKEIESFISELQDSLNKYKKIK